MCGSCSSASWEKEPSSWAQKNKKSDWQLQEEMFCHEHESLSSKKHEEKEKINLHYKTKIMNLYLCNQWNLYDMKLLLWTKRYICKLLDFTCVEAEKLGVWSDLTGAEFVTWVSIVRIYQWKVNFQKKISKSEFSQYSL